MKSLCIIFRHSPHGTSHGREALDLALLSASFEQQVTVIFIDEGVLHLMPQQQPEKINAKDYIATFKAFPLYEIENVFVCKSSLSEYGLTNLALNIDAQLVDKDTIGSCLIQSDEVLVF